ncbi:DarT ssDNA thymidine ADP-ribosyltransferase family protein [Vibrio vulnificus]|uniref:DarT ssDNA thymidine ADP-ribosyltransferase family protein n=1 Tax=Vibrio vulnificus TaxID=672 RepID=UPI0037C3845E
MESNVENIFKIINLMLFNKNVALEFVTNELSFATKSSLVLRNFAKSSGISVINEPPLLDLDSPNVVLSNLLAPLGAYQSTVELRLQLIDKVMKYHGLGKYRDQDSKDRVRAICQERNITELIHFTKVQNVRSILDIGLNSKDYNGEIARKHKVNDLGRFDYRTHMISLSVSYPNDKMFYRYRQMDAGQKWAILSISPSVLWELECLYCPTNAANASISSANDESLYGFQAFDRLFSQQSNQSRLCYPYDSQAEVLVKDHIPSHYVQSVIVDRETDELLDLPLKPIINPFYYQNREYALNTKHL